MKIAIIGAGNVGAALGKAWQERGHEIFYGLRDPAEAKYQKLKGPRAHLQKVGEAVQSAEVVMMAVPWNGVKDAIQEMGPLDGKILVDCTNPLKKDYSGLEIGHDTSAGEKVCEWAKGAKVVKAFNMTGAPNMTPHAKFPVKPVMFVCGNDAGAKKTVLGLAQEVGFDARDAGDITVSRLLEPLAMLWIHLARGMGYGFNFAFAVVTRS